MRVMSFIKSRAYCSQDTLNMMQIFATKTNCDSDYSKEGRGCCVKYS